MEENLRLDRDHLQISGAWVIATRAGKFSWWGARPSKSNTRWGSPKPVKWKLKRLPGQTVSRIAILQLVGHTYQSLWCQRKSVLSCVPISDTWEFSKGRLKIAADSAGFFSFTQHKFSLSYFALRSLPSALQLVWVFLVHSGRKLMIACFCTLAQEINCKKEIFDDLTTWLSCAWRQKVFLSPGERVPGIFFFWCEKYRKKIKQKTAKCDDGNILLQK